jgi:MFS family permease
LFFSDLCFSGILVIILQSFSEKLCWAFRWGNWDSHCYSAGKYAFVVACMGNHCRQVREEEHSDAYHVSFRHYALRVYLSKNLSFGGGLHVSFHPGFQPITSLFDSVALDYIEQSKKSSYGFFRLWASIGWAISSAVTGIFINENNAYIIFIIASNLLLVNFIIIRFIYKPLIVVKNLKSLKLSHIKDIFLSDKRLYIMLIIMLFYGIFSAPMHFFINIYYLDIGGGYHHVGYAYLVQALAEVPFFIYGKRIIDRFGARRIVIITMIVTSIRLLAYGLNSNPWIAIAIGATHGVSMGLFILAFIVFVHQFIPPEFRATGQSFVYSFYFGGGLALGNILTGFISDQIGMQGAMLVQGSLTFLLIIITLLIFGVYKRMWNDFRRMTFTGKSQKRIK